MLNGIEKFFGLSASATSCPFRTDCTTTCSPGPDELTTYTTEDHHGYYNLYRISLRLGIVAGCLNSLAAVAFRVNPAQPLIYGITTIFLSHAVDIFSHQCCHKPKKSYKTIDFARFFFTFAFHFTAFNITRDPLIYPTPFTTAMKACFVIIPCALDLAIHAKYFHHHYS